MTTVASIWVAAALGLGIAANEIGNEIEIVLSATDVAEDHIHISDDSIISS